MPGTASRSKQELRQGRFEDPAFTRPALVTDGLWRKSLSAVRSLGKAGFEVAVMGDSVFTTGFWSTFTEKRIIAPTAAANPDGFGKRLLETLEENPGSVLLPMEDTTLRWVSTHRKRIQELARILLPSPEALETAWDKSATLALAEEMGLPCPRTWRPSNPEELCDIVAGIQGEFVTKPLRGSGSAGVCYGNRDSRTPAEWKRHWERFGPMLVQERVPAQGQGLGASLLFDAAGECIAAFAHERLQQYPNSGGPSTDRQSLYAPELLEMSIRLLKRLNWRGIAMVEWKADPRDGRPKLMEINPRFWGSLELAIRSGVDFPQLYARAALGERIEPVLRYPAGVRCRWVIPGDILRYITQPAQSRESVREFLRGLPGQAEEWDPEDPAGALATIICTGAAALNPRYWKYVSRG
ncbi:MAG: ATP-grasp domain-containing protein [Oligoflexia bacterium]|nr:ATP-grasp domain-containing protein [Oligoflexia bacterium]